MSLMQTILDQIEADAAADSQRALASAGLIAEAEVLRDLLRANGCPDAKATFDPSTGNVIFYLWNASAAVRQAIEDAGLEIEREFWSENAPNCRQLHLKSLACTVWIDNDRPALAKAA